MTEEEYAYSAVACRPTLLSLLTSSVSVRRRHGVIDSEKCGCDAEKMKPMRQATQRICWLTHDLPLLGVSLTHRFYSVRVTKMEKSETANFPNRD